MVTNVGCVPSEQKGCGHWKRECPRKPSGGKGSSYHKGKKSDSSAGKKGEGRETMVADFETFEIEAEVQVHELRIERTRCTDTGVNIRASQRTSFVNSLAFKVCITQVIVLQCFCSLPFKQRNLNKIKNWGICGAPSKNKGCMWNVS